MTRARVAWGSSLVFIIALSSCPSDGFAQAEILAVPAADARAGRTADQALSRLVDVDLEDATIGDLAKFVAERIGLNVVIDRKALEDAGIDPNAQAVTLRVTAAPLAGVFHLALEQQDLSWQIQDGMILITTPEQQEQTGLELRVYPVDDLVRVDGGVANDLGSNHDYDTLIDLLVTTVAPDSWDEVGGPGSISPMPNRSALVIGQTRDVQGRVGRLLEALRRVPRSSWAPASNRTSFAVGRGSRAIGPAEWEEELGDEPATPAVARRSGARPRWLTPRTYE